MSEQGDLFKQEGMEVAAEAVSTWSQEARNAIDYLAECEQEFTSEQVIELIGLPRQVGMNRNNAVGAAMSGAARRGVIRRVGYRNAQRPESHSAVLAVWVGVGS